MRLGTKRDSSKADFSSEVDLVTLYRSEITNPSLIAAMDWAKKEVFDEFVRAGDNKDLYDTLILAGGALRSFFTGTAPNDLDVFGSRWKDACAVLQMDTDRRSHYRVLSDTDRSKTLGLPNITNGTNGKNRDVAVKVINLIKNSTLDSPQAVIRSFDFTVCMCAVTPELITYHPDYFIDLASKSLRFNNKENMLEGLWRLQKYMGLGYTISKEELWRVAEAIHDLPSLPTVIMDRDQETDDGFGNTSNATLLSEIFRSS